MSTLTLEQLGTRMFLNVTEAAQLLQVDPRTLRRSIDAGECPHVRVSGVVRVPVPAFLQWAGIDLETAKPRAPTAAIASRPTTRTK
jgi:excisionase family DNA binding protein